MVGHHHHVSLPRLVAMIHGSDAHELSGQDKTPCLLGCALLASMLNTCHSAEFIAQLSVRLHNIPQPHRTWHTCSLPAQVSTCTAIR